MASGSSSRDDDRLEQLQDQYSQIEEEVSVMDALLDDLEGQMQDEEDRGEASTSGTAGETGDRETPIILQLSGSESDSEVLEKLQQAHKSMRREHLSLREILTKDVMSYLRDVAGAVRRIGDSMNDLNQRVQDHDEALDHREAALQEVQERVQEQGRTLERLEERVRHIEARADFIADELGD